MFRDVGIETQGSGEKLVELLLCGRHDASRGIVSSISKGKRRLCSLIRVELIRRTNESKAAITVAPSLLVEVNFIIQLGYSQH